MPQSIIHPADPGPWGRPKGPPGDSGRGAPSGPKRPAGKPPGGDFDAWWRDFRARAERFFGGPNQHRAAGAALLAIAILWLASGIYQLQTGEQGVVLRFGRFDRMTTSGLHYHLPAPVESLEIVNSEAVRMQTLGAPGSAPHGGSTGTEGDEILMLTGDENIINLSFNVEWKVRDPKQFVFSLPNPEETVRAVTESAMREVIGRTTLESALTEGKSRVQEETRRLIQATLDSYRAGIQVLQINLLDAGFPQAVVDAARDVQAARADQERARNEAEAYTNDLLPRARGQAQRMLQEAQAYKQEVVARAEGDAARFLSVYAQYREAKDITRKRIYLETMERILAGTHKILVDSKPGATPILPLPMPSPPAAEKADKPAKEAP